MARKNQKQWIYRPSKRAKPKVPEAEKQMITERCQQLIDIEFKPKYIQENPYKGDRIIEEIFGKWYRNFFYFCCIYRFTAPEMVDKAIEDKFTRLEYAGEDLFNLAYMRHTGQWWVVNEEIKLERALAEIKKNQIFHP